MNKLKHANGNHPLTEKEKQEMIEEAAEHYGNYMSALGFDWKEDPNSSDTPIRVAKAFVNDLASGVYNEPPKITAFENVNSVGLILRINSPGGSPVQSALIYDEIRRLKKEHPEKKVIAVVEDVAASGGYFIASAADKIFVNKSSIVGSIGVVFNGFGFVELLKKIGVERRLLVSGEKKSMLDPFLPKEEEEEFIIREMMEDLHRHFIEAVKVGRGSLLIDDPEIFSGRVFTGEESITLGLSDGFGSVSSVADEVFSQPFLIEYHGEENLLDKLTENFISRLIVTLKNLFLVQTVEHSIF